MSQCKRLSFGPNFVAWVYSVDIFQKKIVNKLTNYVKHWDNSKNVSEILVSDIQHVRVNVFGWHQSPFAPILLESTVPITKVN